MPITRITAWAYDGHNYTTELSAVEANLKAIGQKIAKHHSASPVSGLIEYRDELAGLLIRHAELTANPEGTQTDFEGTRVAEALEDGLREHRARAAAKVEDGVSLEDMEFPVALKGQEITTLGELVAAGIVECDPLTGEPVL